MNQSRLRKTNYPELYGTKECPGAGLTRSTSKGRGLGTIGARHEGQPFLFGVSFFKSTESGSLQESGSRQKNPALPPPERFTYRRPTRAREGANA